ncbi:transporter substrate-binding domain-containing protein [Halobacteriovorax sp. GB3]|uniref:substrate-binding periplasmic protein n=1 Tax=Halobacteriovorax sp. GB3 TaxID=2719615 RepID=UPI00235FDE06|nr:transporter substrate-binding domain-containing protein [Halobacteriovorax sp. GB3]MDD0853837.1 transporter substrate-binding domain-containing protein [Halobacteriovorax sp. GB3]
MEQYLKILFHSFLFVCFSTASMADASNDIRDYHIVTESYAPLNFKSAKEVKGISVEIMDEILKRFDIQEKKYTVYPWARAYKTIQEKENTIVFSMVRNESREKMFKWVGPIYPSEIAIYAKKARYPILRDISEVVDGAKVGAIKNDIGEIAYLNAGGDKNLTYNVGSVERGVMMLDLERIDFLAAESLSVQWLMKVKKIDITQFHQVFHLNKTAYYIAFHPSTPDVLVKRMQEILDSLKKDGTYDKIIAKYLR